MKATICARAVFALILNMLVVVVNSSPQKTTDKAQSTPVPQGSRPAKNIAATRQVDELIDAAEKGDLARVKELLAAKVDVNAMDKFGYFALDGASAQGHLEVVKALLAAGADVDEKNNQEIGALYVSVGILR